MILALAGGVGGARLARGLAAILPADGLTVAVNTGDDFEHLGLLVCPDIDTVCYTLAGINNTAQGWGLEGESWSFMDALGKLGGEAWFNLGDRDLATHVLRTAMIGRHDLSEITALLAARMGIVHRIVPMSDQRVRTIVDTDEGALPFQHYFVRRRAEPRFRGIGFEGIDEARPSAGLLAAIDDPALEAIILCPSNPVLSITPILALPGLRDRLTGRKVPIVAVSPFIGGRAIKGPAAKIMDEIGIATTPAGLAAYFNGLLDGIVIDRTDAGEVAGGVALHVTDTLMRDIDDQRRLAMETLAFARSLG
ncbi:MULTISPECIES: 2-phospho-L-lactate transferase [unclassified Sphingomonas]|uniref:2-phospho-L-lactate transferase n=1 Tax=unclassified Sphingomonas TaxID=196159 RepID=UPI0006F60BCF|nr:MULTISPECIES: 2-phospho-L-lactate transferase [unclassified Sphingomonas]KQX20022.1 2-phospho-L-lactate transferase [Sphingomonas sp. Root1294]KQY67271.1 2-phospho-L-lactate transferase [Sphingomonas sp. Root50]KRB90645.1 2-phospho-L-lactate transferase [Sphingomonas sp. Root720]